MPIKVGETLKNQDLPQESICMIILAILTVCFVASNSVKLCAPLAIHKKTPIIKLLLKTGLTQANGETRFLVDIYVLKTMIYCQNLVSLRKSCKNLKKKRGV